MSHDPDRYDRFVISTVSSSPAPRAAGALRELYDRLFDAARAAGHARVLCEVNADPPQPCLRSNDLT